MQTALRCACGAVRGIAHGLSPETGNRVICYCEDCRAFARYLGRADEILDAAGGTDIFQTSSSRFELTLGAERLACVRLTAKGPLRWYVDCCRTPIGNTGPLGRVPFVGLIVACLEFPSDRGESLDAVLGPVRMRVAARDALERPLGDDVYDGFPLRLRWRIYRLLFAASRRGEAPFFPFFDPATGKPVRTPQTVEEAELRRLRSAH